MIFPQLSSNGIPIRLGQGIPGSYRGFLLVADTWFTEDYYGLLIIQQRLVHDKWLRYCILKPKVKIMMYFEADENWFRLFINLGSALKQQEGGDAKIHIRQAQWLLRPDDVKIKRIELKAGREYEFLESWYGGEKIGEFQPAFPILKNLPARPQWLLPHNTEAIKEIIGNPYAEAAQSIYYDIGLDNILFGLLSQLSNPTGIQASDFEIEACYQAKIMLEENIKHPPDLKVIARKVELSDYKLKQLFQKIYHKTAFELFMQAKMHRAYRLVTTTDEAIKSIAIDTGYKWPMNFATAFRKHFGEAPETLRDKLRNYNI